MKINKERTGIGMSFKALYSPQKLKNKMNTVSEYLTGVFVPSDVSWQGECYSFYISHRQSLREYIYENGIKRDDFFVFIKSITELFDKAYQYNVDPHEFVFDYECVFIGNSLADVEFIYAPDAETYKDDYVVHNKCSDMVSIVSLHIDEEISDFNKQENISEILRILYEWESKALSEKATFPKEELLPLTIKHKMFFDVGEYLKEKLQKAYDVFLKVLNSKGETNMKLNGEMLLRNVKYTTESENEINIGRDSKWADIAVEMMYVSRKHATIYKEKDTWYIKDLNSKNGTFVNGARIAAEKPFSLNNGYEISFGLPESKLIFCLP